MIIGWSRDDRYFMISHSLKNEGQIRVLSDCTFSDKAKHTSIVFVHRWAPVNRSNEHVFPREAAISWSASLIKSAISPPVIPAIQWIHQNLVQVLHSKRRKPMTHQGNPISTTEIPSFCEDSRYARGLKQLEGRGDCVLCSWARTSWM